MSFTAVIKNNVAILPEGMHLPDGTEVVVEMPEKRPAVSGSFLERFRDLAGSVQLRPDGAENVDHYLYGSPKKAS